MGMCRLRFEIPTHQGTLIFFLFFLIFVTLSWTLEVEITTLKDSTYQYVFLPKPFQQNNENSKQQINSKNVFLSIFVIFYIFWQVSHISADWFHNHNRKQKSSPRKSNQLCTLFFSGRALLFSRIGNWQWFRTC